MNFFKFGIIDFFGILAPGVIFVVNKLIFFYAFMSLFDWGLRILCDISKSHFFKKIILEGNNWIMLSIIVLIICYTWGFILRLIRPDLVGKTSTIYFRFIHPKKMIIEKRDVIKKFVNTEHFKSFLLKMRKEKSNMSLLVIIQKYIEEYYIPKLIEEGKKMPDFVWCEEKYPYYLGTKYIYQKAMPEEITESILDDNRFHRSYNYNYWKLLLTARNPNLSALIYQAEAHVRFLCGSFWALSFGFLSCLILCLPILINPHQYAGIKLAIGISGMLFLWNHVNHYT